MNRTIDGSFKYLVVDDNRSIKGYIKNLPPLPHDENSTVRVFDNPDSHESKLLKFAEIDGNIIHFGMRHIYDHITSKAFFQC